MSFPRYPEYKDSGVEWLGEVPISWNAQPLLAVASERYQPNFGMVEDNLLSLSYGRIVRKDIESNDGLLPESFETYQIVEPNDIVFRLTDLQNDKRSLRTAIVTQRGIITSAYLAISPQKAVPQYLHYLLRACDEQKVFYSMGGGLRQSMKYSDVKRLQLAVPPRDEQFAIAAFLDHETAKIDALVAEQEKLIALLKEKRQAVISHAVTKGLNPDAPMKDSGIEWLGEVPVHWEIGPLKRFTNVIDCKHHTVQFLDEGWPIVSIRELHDDRIDLADAKLTSREEWEFLREGRVPQRGDMIFCRNASVGAVGYIDFEEPFCMGQDVCLIRPDSKSRYMHFQLTSALIRNQMEALLVGATIRRANVEEIRGLLIANPPPDEQDEIAQFLSAETARFDALSADAEQAVGLLKERRSTLISAAVAGKIDVRGIAASSPVSVEAACA
jgi:type I restriction enzyme S subunit